MNRYLIYTLRWLISGIILLLPMFLLKLLGVENDYLRFILISFVGAIIFYPIDKYIFYRKDK